jgi:hypothetical protein
VEESSKTGGAPELKAVRRRLNRLLRPVDAHGYRYEAVFGCAHERTSVCPHARVRCELGWTEGSHTMSFVVFVDYHLPIGVRVAEAESFKDDVIAATRKARRVQSVVRGLSWTMEEVRKAD